MNEYIMSHTGAELDEAISKVQNGYLNPETMITHTTKSASGQFTGSGQPLNEITINVGFKPKIFIIQNQDAVWTGSDALPYSMVGAVMICDNNYTIQQARVSFVLKGNSSQGWGRGGQSGKSFEPTENGVQGSISSVKATNNVLFNWWAWG